MHHIMRRTGTAAVSFPIIIQPAASEKSKNETAAGGTEPAEQPTNSHCLDSCLLPITMKYCIIRATNRAQCIADFYFKPSTYYQPTQSELQSLIDRQKGEPATAATKLKGKETEERRITLKKRNSTMSSKLLLPRLYLGTMTFGWEKSSIPVTEAIATEMISRAASVGVRHVDSARIYSGGDCESIVGASLRNFAQTNPELRGQLLLTTKVHPSQPNGLSAQGIKEQLRISLDCLGVESIDELYLHQPDTVNDLSESLAACHELVTQGLVKRLGISNYHDVEVERCLQLCKENNWTAPTVYQGLYNPLNRLVESSLLPLLRRNSIDFIAYNALAAGLLTGKHTDMHNIAVGRFRENPNYLPRFYTKANFRAINVISKSLPEGMDLLTASYRWLLCHSMLASPSPVTTTTTAAATGAATESRNGLLLGASSLEQLDSNLRACVSASSAATRSLTENTLRAFDEAWNIIRTDGTSSPFPYWRSYSKDQPNRDSMDPGAAYDAHHKK